MTTEIGPAGGTLVGPNGARVIIPEGALAAPTPIAIRAVSAAAAPPLAGGLAYGGDVLSFEPHGVTFSVPVRVELPLEAGSANGNVVHASCMAGTAGADACKAWDEAPLAGVTFEPGFASFTTRSFSLYAPSVVVGGVGGAGGGSLAGCGGGCGGGGPPPAPAVRAARARPAVAPAVWAVRAPRERAARRRAPIKAASTSRTRAIA
ncbi:hypothetical protein A7982_13480 [Minicystis rosea]|nr:hypothetical protein A7982_13480 [Minicystis rosea]